MNRYPQLGSVSSGTLRTEDLLTAFADALEELAGDAQQALVDEARNIDPSSEDEDAEFVLDELYNALQDLAPPYCYFGPHPADGADFGFWVDDLALQIAQADGELICSNDPPAESAPDGVEAWLYINDHGNATLYMRDNGEWREVWSVV